MFFSNLIAYKFKEPANSKYPQEALEDSLRENVFRPCGAQDLQTVGWSKSLGKHGETLAHYSADYILLCIKKEEKVIPSKVLNELVQNRVDAIEQEHARAVRKKEREEIKERALEQMMEQAFTFSTVQYAYVDMERGYLVVNSGSFNKAEEFAAMLRKAIGTLPIVPMFSHIDLDVHLTSWLTNGDKPEMFTIGGDATLIEPDDNAAQLKVKGHDLASDEIQAHLDGGSRVSELSLCFGENLTFTLASNGSIKKVKYSDLLKEENADIPKEDMPVKLDADFLLCAAELSNMLSHLEAVGGDSAEAE